jgi:carbamoyl-phosphate synthase large subunit
MTCNVLLSSAGRRVALMESFRAALARTGLGGKIVATDASRASAAFHAADVGVVVPRCTTGKFIPAMLEVCAAYDISLVVPTIDTELSVLAAHRAAFAAIGVTVAVSDPETVAIGADKVLTHAWLVEHGLPTVRQADPEVVRRASDAWAYPLVVKPIRGSASIGVVVVDDALSLDVATRAGDCIVQTVAPGEEYTVDVFVDALGRVREAVPRRRLEVRGGEVSKGMTERIDDVESLARELGGLLPGAFGALNVQLFRDPTSGSLAVIEVNARFGGGYPLAEAAGAIFPQWLVEHASGVPLSPVSAAWRAGVVMLRYDDAVFVDASGAGL